MKYLTPALLRKAVFENLWDGNPMNNGTPASCCAVDRAGGFTEESYEAYLEIMGFLRKNGVDGLRHPFDDIPSGPERQNARALWLLFVAEGIEIGALCSETVDDGSLCFLLGC